MKLLIVLFTLFGIAGSQEVAKGLADAVAQAAVAIPIALTGDLIPDLVSFGKAHPAIPATIAAYIGHGELASRVKKWKHNVPSQTLLPILGWLLKLLKLKK